MTLTKRQIKINKYINKEHTTKVFYKFIIFIKLFPNQCINTLFTQIYNYYLKIIIIITKTIQFIT